MNGKTPKELSTTQWRLRPLGGMEQGLWLGDQASSLNFCAVAEVRGPLSATHLEGALRAAQRRHPLLRVRIAQGKKSLTFVGWPDDDPPPIPLRVVEAPAAEWVALANREVQTALPWREQPLVRSTWIQHDDDRGTLLLCFNHMIGDGTSGAYLARDVLRACSRLAAGQDADLAPLPLPPNLEQLLPKGYGGLRGFLRGLGARRRMMKRLKRLGGLPAQIRSDDVNPFELPPAQRQSHFLPLAFGPEQTRALVQTCRAERTTLHGLMMAVWCKTVQPELDGPVVSLGSPVNLRHRMEPEAGEDICLYVSMASSQHRLDADRELFDLAREMRSELVTAVDRREPFAFIPLMNMIGRQRWLFPFTQKGIARHARFFLKNVAPMSTTGLTNIGALDLESRQGPLTIDAVHFIVSTSILGHLILSAASLDDNLRVNVMYTKPLVTTERAQALGDRFSALLLSALD